MMKGFEYRPTKDDWCPNFDNNLVRVTLHTCMVNNGKMWHRVCVWGDDDCGMEKDFHGKETKKDAVKLYKYLLSLPHIEKKILKGLGFVPA
jgi:hypothetical protein